MKTSEARKLIGKRIVWDETSPRYVFTRETVILEVQGRNYRHESGWAWLPDIPKGFRIEEKDAILGGEG